MPASALADRRPTDAASSRRVDRVVVSDRLSDVRSDWTQLLAVAPASAYQTPGWIEPWLASLGQALRPVFVLGYHGPMPVALLPLGVRRHGGLAVARFLGGRDVNFGLGLFDPSVAWDAPTLRHLLDAAAREAGIDLFWLANQPAGLAGPGNPLLQLPHHASPSLQHETTLLPDPEAVLARTLSSRARKHIRQKEAKLAALGPVHHDVATTPGEADRIVTALLAQRATRFGRPAEAAALHRFLVAAATGGPSPAVELHALRCADTIVAAFAGAPQGGRLSGMLISFATEGEWARLSPGELLLARVVVAQCRAGMEHFDLGIGEARYKQSFCPTPVPLFDTILGVSPLGLCAARGAVALLAAKRRIKRSPRLWQAATRLRALARRLSGGFAPGRP